jgi:thiamine biosynthesis lipoprotein
METQVMNRLSFEAIGTAWDIQLHEPLRSSELAALEQQIHARIEQFDAAYSRFRTDSLVSHMARAAGSYDLPNDGYVLLQFYEQLYQATEGKVTPLIGQTVSDAGYDAGYSLESKRLHRPPAWKEVISYDHHTLHLQKPALLDFGAAGKGYLVDIIAGLLEAAGIYSYLINAGGDIHQRSASGQAVEVGMENPLANDEAIGVAPLSNKSLCASSGSKRSWGKYTHILDPDTLRSPQDIVATWTIANTTMVADGLATALFFTAPEYLRTFDFAYAILASDMQLTYSANFPVTTFTEEQA